MINETRAAEFGGKIVTSADGNVVFERNVIGVIALETTVVQAISCVSEAKLAVEGISYYVGKTLQPGASIDANLASIHLTSGAVQAIYQA